MEARLRFAYQVARTLNELDSSRVVQAWLTGVNPELGERVTLRLLKEGNLDEIAPQVLGVAKAFIAGAYLWADPGFDDSQWETVDLTPALTEVINRNLSSAATAIFTHIAMPPSDPLA